MEENKNPSPDAGREHQALVLQPTHAREFYEDTAPKPAVAPAPAPAIAPVPISTPQSPQALAPPQPVPVPPKTTVPDMEPATASIEPAPAVPLWVRLVLLVALCAYAAPVVVLTRHYPWPLAVVCLGLPVALLGQKKVKGIFLPYAVCIAAIIFAVDLLRDIHSRSNAGVIAKYVPGIGSRPNSTVILTALAVGAGLALVAFAAANYGPRLSKTAANTLFRSLAVWLVFFAGSYQYVIINNASYASQYAAYHTELDNYNAEGLDPRLPIYNPLPPAVYRLTSTHAADKNVVHQSYERDYTAIGTKASGATVKVSIGSVPSTCEHTNTPQSRQDAFGKLYSCNVVTTTSGGQEVYGYRDLSGLHYSGIDATNLTASQLRQIPPSNFYVQKSSAVLVEIIYGNSIDIQNNPFTPANINAMVDSLQDSSTSRQAFVSQYIKPPKPIVPYRYQEKVFVPLTIALAVYCALMLWSLERIFSKAGRAYWKAYVPLANLWILAKIADRPGWWSLLVYLPSWPAASVVQFIYVFIYFAFFLLPLAYAFTLLKVFFYARFCLSLAEQFNKPQWFALLLFAPPFSGYFMLGFDSSRHQSAEQEAVSPPKLSPASF